MKATIYSKKKQTKEGRTFYAYVAKMTKKDGSEMTMGAKFREEAGAPRPEECPMNIVFDKANGNIATKNYVNEDGEICESRTLWVSKWTQGEPYVDHSLDEFEE